MKRTNVFKPHKATASKVFNGRANVDALYKTPEWVSYRSRFLQINNRCYPCGAESTVVDHIIPHRGDKSLFEKPDNMIPMCVRCHNTVTGLFDKKYVKGTPPTAKLTWMAKRRALNGVSFRVYVIPYVERP